MMYLIVVFGVIASSLALPVIPDPPSLPNRNVSGPKHLDCHTRNVKPFKLIVVKEKNNDIKTNSNPVLQTRKQTENDCIYLQKQLFELKQELKKTNQEIKNKTTNNNKTQQPETTVEKVNYEDIPEQDSNSNDKIEKKNEKVNLVAVPPPPTLPPFDYSTLKKQKYQQNKQPDTTTEKISYEDCPEQNNNDNDETEKENVEVALVTVPPPPALPPYDYSALQKQKYEQKQQPETTTEKVNYEDISEQDNNDNDKTEKKNVKVALVAVPPPPTLPPFDYSTLKKQKYQQTKQPGTTTEKISYEECSEQDNNGDGDTEKENIEVPSVNVPPPPALTLCDYSALQKQKYEQKQQPETTSEKINYEDIPEQDNNGNDRVENKNVKVNLVAVPPPPTLPPFDYSTLKKQKYQQNKQPDTTTEKIYFEDVTEQNNNGNDETENIEVASVTIPPPPALPPYDYSVLQKQKFEQKQQPKPSSDKVNYEDIPEQYSNDNDKSEKKNVTVTLVALPPPPTLPPFDYSTLKKQKFEQNKQPKPTTEKISYEDCPEQANDDNDETEKENIEVASITVPPPPALPPYDYSALQKQKYEQKQQPETTTDKVNYEDIPEQDNNDNDKTEKKNVKVALVAVPPPPTLPPFDYSTLKKQKYQQNKQPETTTQKLNGEDISEQDNGELKEGKPNVPLVSVAPPSEIKEKPERLYPSLPKFGMQCLCRVPSISRNRRVLCNLPLDTYQ